MDLSINRCCSFLLLILASLCASGCATPLIALGSSAAGWGMQALGGAAGTAGMKLVSDKVSDTFDDYVDGGHVADVTYETSPTSLKSIVDQTLQRVVASPYAALDYTRTDDVGSGVFVLATSSGSELQIAIQGETPYATRATQMVADIELADATSQESDSSLLTAVLNEIDSKTQAQGIDRVRGEFNYVAGHKVYDRKTNPPRMFA